MSYDDHHGAATLKRPPEKLDYSLVGDNAARAVERGLAEADWYQCPVPRATMRKLLERRDGPAIRDTIIWFGLIFVCGFFTWLLWPTYWAMIPYLAYAVLYASTSDSRWHESSHGTAFKTDWMNNALYEISSFMVMRNSTRWRWSHTRHHSDTIIVGRDPEIAVPRPPDLVAIGKAFLGIQRYPKYFKQELGHVRGKLLDEEKMFIPESEHGKVILRARIAMAIYAGVLMLSFATQSMLPIFLALPHLFGSWLMTIYGITQHAGMAENVLDHRLNCRTVYMNRVNRFLYWNMGYHVEHHMFPLVPYHQLPALHEVVKHDMPEPYPSLFAAWLEIIPAVIRQTEDPAYHIKRKLPEPSERVPENCHRSSAKPDDEGWLEVCAAADLDVEDVIRFDHERRTFALYRDDAGQLYATDGICTHGNTHLGDGLVKGKMIECPKHNGRFNLEDGSPARAPICRGLATYPIEERGGRLWLNVERSGGVGARAKKTYQLRVVSNQSISTFIKELVLEPMSADEPISFTPGDYLQLDIPAYEEIRFADFDIPEPYAAVWRRQGVFDLKVSNPESGRRNNYSLAGNVNDRQLRFNVRIATPPPGQDCPPGVGSSYVFSLKPGDEVTAIGSFGDFHIKPTQKEMIYIGGGAGMAPLRAHLTQLFENDHTARKVSFWYGARSRQEIFYADYFENLAEKHANFDFHLALSDPLDEDNWTGSTGFIHEVVLEEYLQDHPNVRAVEFYLCGPPTMIKACTKMLASLGVEPGQLAFDEF
ncbi:NADH:ubiquinone reductase (Na(+)-transporting) subunit F [Cerasicoccus fimbriatus]|uniref:NADH:ubiquinone reductase (Na(+)-transporting) subunit F n=1 Tax=Cerasicoccus fimbriatus TaxID=3014554 RepID=UPI0022B4D164|nr:NADH:ubiquinone reductase (Na(+)-transporting) subunit F [Cerasicoccus sp. TK19100]